MDFESLLEPIQGPGLNPMGPWTSGTSNHIPSGWCTYGKFAYGKVEDPLTLYRGKDCVCKFCDLVIGEARRLYKSFPEVPMNPLTPKEIEGYKKSKKCHIYFGPGKILKCVTIVIIVGDIEEPPSGIVS